MKVAGLVTAINPRTGDPTGAYVPETTDEQLDSVVEKASTAFVTWSRFNAADRATALRLVADRIDANADELATIADVETGLGMPRLISELVRCTTQIRMLADVIEADPALRAVVEDWEPSNGRPSIVRVLIPRGVVAVFAASNFPFAFSVAGGDTASALAAGCAVVVKAHEGHPATSELSGRIIDDALRTAGAPEGLFSVVAGRRAGLRLVSHAKTSAASFTGSYAAGRRLQALAARRPTPIPFFGEFGSINPAVILASAVRSFPERLASGFVESLTSSAGQLCTKPGLVFVPAGSPVIDLIASAVSESESGALLNESIYRAYRSYAPPVGARLLARGRTNGTAFSVPADVFIADLERFSANPKLLSAERFGPSSVLVEYHDIRSVVETILGLPGSLAAAIHADEASDRDSIVHLSSAFRGRAGRLVLNGWTTGVAVTPAQHHGGPPPATSDPGFTSVGARSIDRWLVPMVYQNWNLDSVSAMAIGLRE